jgi:Domain of unknown function (DUF4190)/zinc-ribbon domain
MFCMKCGATNPDSGRFCAACGAPLVGQTTLPGAALPIGAALSVPGIGPGYAAPTQTDGKAIASLICGICFFIFPAAVAAIILGHLSLSEIKRDAGRLTGRGMATAGLVLGYAGVLFIPFILIVAAIAIPNLLLVRTAANEASAAASLRTIASAAFIYSTKYSNGYPPSLVAIDGTADGAASCDHAQLLDSELASGRRRGYVFTYTPVPNGEIEARTLSAQAKANGCTVPGAESFTITAEPLRRGTTGTKSFFVDQTGVIRVEENGTAGADSPVLGGSERF